MGYILPPAGTPPWVTRRSFATVPSRASGPGILTGDQRFVSIRRVTSRETGAPCPRRERSTSSVVDVVLRPVHHWSTSRLRCVINADANTARTIDGPRDQTLSASRPPHRGVLPGGASASAVSATMFGHEGRRSTRYRLLTGEEARGAPLGMKRRWPIPGDTCNDPAAQHPRALAQRDCRIHSTSPYRTNRTSPDDTSCCSSSGRTTLCVRPVDPSSRLAHATIARLSRHPCRPSPHEWGGDLRSPVYTPWGIYATLSSKPPIPGS